MAKLPPIENLPAERARCQTCGKPLKCWTKDTHEGPGAWQGPIVRRVYERPQGYPKGSSSPLWCTLRCVLHYATSVYASGVRLQLPKAVR